MKDTIVQTIADNLNISSSTVSRAVRHCSNVDSETRHRILMESRRLNYMPQSSCTIYAILPDNPQYFWCKLRKGIADGADNKIAPVKYNIYTKPNDEATVLEYLKDAERLKARAIILATHMTPTIRKKLENMTEGRLILLLSEYYELTNAFYVGADSYRDGYIMGKQYLKHYSDRKLVLLSVEYNNNIEKRIAGFRQAIKDEKPQLLDTSLCFELDSNIFRNRKLIPSKLATLLGTVSKTKEALCIYLPMGITQFPLALVKAKLTEQTVCLCHDCYTEHPYKDQNLDTDFAITCNQNMREQGLTAIRLATAFVKENLYPEQKENFVSSVLDIQI